MKDLNDLFYRFLWNGGPDKVKRTVLNQKLENGGLAMINLKVFDQSLKLSWVKRFFTSEAKWKEVIEAKYPKLVNIQKFGSSYTKKLADEMKNPFWQNVLRSLVIFYQ